MSEKYTVANGLRLAYDEFGTPSNPAIVLIMGLGTQMVAWPVSLCEALADSGYRVIRFDNRDIGLSEKINVKKRVNIAKIFLQKKFGLSPSAPYTLRDMAADTIGLLDRLDIQSAHWVGASMGGMIAQILAAEYPGRSLSLTSIMSTTGNPELPQPSLKVLRLLMGQSGEINKTSYLKHSLNVWSVIGSPDYPPNKEELTARILANFNRNYSPSGHRNQTAAIIQNGDRRALLRKIKVPSLVIHGKADVLIPCEGGIETAANIKGAELKLVEGMGHDLPKELLPRFTRWITQNIQRAQTT